MSSLVPHSVKLESDSDPEGDFKASYILTAVQTVLRHDKCAPHKAYKNEQAYVKYEHSKFKCEHCCFKYE